MISTFTAIDYETAHPKRWSICSAGFVRVEHGITKDKLIILVQPPGNEFWDNFIDIHGITPPKTAGETNAIRQNINFAKMNSSD